jgi:hypothetical protein
MPTLDSDAQRLAIPGDSDLKFQWLFQATTVDALATELER